MAGNAQALQHERPAVERLDPEFGVNTWLIWQSAWIEGNGDAIYGDTAFVESRWLRDM